MDAQPIDKRDPRTYAIIGAAMEVHRELGPGFLEKVYHEALIEEFDLRAIPYLHEPPLPVHYKAKRLRTVYEPDFVCFGSVLVELKAQKFVGDPETAQVLNYLKASKLATGLLINFGEASLDFERFAMRHPPMASEDRWTVTGSAASPSSVEPHEARSPGLAGADPSAPPRPAIA